MTAAREEGGDLHQPADITAPIRGMQLVSSVHVHISVGKAHGSMQTFVGSIEKIILTPGLPGHE